MINITFVNQSIHQSMNQSTCKSLCEVLYRQIIWGQEIVSSSMLIVCSLSHVYWYGLSIALDLTTATTGRITAVLEQKPEVKLLNCGCLLSWEQLDMNTIFVGAKQENIMTCFCLGASFW